MAFLGILYAVFAWFWIQYLPGYMVSRAFVPGAEGMQRHGLALICGFSVVPLCIFLVTVMAGIPMDATLLWIVASAINVGGALFVIPRDAWQTPDVGLVESLWLLAAALLAGVFLLFGLRSLDGGDIFSTIHHCLYVIVMHTIANDASWSVPLFDGISGDTIHYLVHHPTTEFNGLAPLFFEQRLGNAPILAPAVAVLGTVGWYVTTLYATIVTGTCIYLAAMELKVRPLAAGLAALIFCYAIHLFLGYFVNENLYAVTLVAFLFWACLKDKLSPGWLLLIGIVCGHLVGVRYTSCLFWPAVAMALIWRNESWKERLRGLGTAGILALIFVLPWLYVNFVMLGEPITHPKIDSEFASRIVTNSFLGYEFQFRALNWPFADAVFRTAWNPFPTFLWMALWTGLCFGQVAFAIAVTGFIGLWRNRRPWVLVLAFALPHSMAIGLMESLDWEQLTYAAPGLVPLGLVLAVGIHGFLETVTRKRTLITAGVVLVLIVDLSLGGRLLNFDVDRRTLSAKDWPAAPAADKGTKAVKEMLTSVSPLPKMPVFRSGFAELTLSGFGHLLHSDEIGSIDGLPSYPSGKLAVLAGYASRVATQFSFGLEGGALRSPDDAIRTSLGLHLVSLSLPAKQLKVEINRDDGVYEINLSLVGTANQNRDFSFWLHPWSPPVKHINVNLDGQPIQALRTLTYGGTREEGETRFIVTNYPKSKVDVIRLAYEVDKNDESAHCGLFLFTNGVDEEHVETLVLAGGHDQNWLGDNQGEIFVPKNILADSVVLFSEPYCSDHVPQYGDRYSRIDGPFEDGQVLKFKLDRQW